VGKARLDPLALLGVRDALLKDRVELVKRRVRGLSLGDAGAHPDHVGEGPVGHSLAIGEAPTSVVVGELREAVEVLVELPGKA